MDIVPDEWLLDCMRPTDERYSISKQFLDLLERMGDRIVIRENSPFVKKLQTFLKVHPLHFKSLVLMMYDSNRVVRLSEESILRLPKEIDDVVPDDDKYLVELLFSTADKVFVTTDGPLVQKIKGQNEFRVFLFDEFMRFYNK